MSLQKFFSPETIAVIGASTNKQKLGYSVFANIVNGGFPSGGRQVVPINPKAAEIIGIKAYPDVQSVPFAIDLAVIVIPYVHVPEVLRECGEKGIGAAIVISAGFREAGADGARRELELLNVATAYGIRLIGPNCLGVIDTNTPLNASFAHGMPPGGPMAFMSQSGALGTAILDWAMAGRLGLSKFVSLGNKADVSETDLLEIWRDDAHSKVILSYIEGLPDGEAFIRAARKTSKVKPVVAIKSGITQAGARAVTSHTGSLAGSEQAYNAAFREAGIIRADSLQDLFDLALAFGYLPDLQGDRIAIITNAGGPGILATDALERAGLKLARFHPETLGQLEQFLPDAASAANPVDLLGDALADRYQFAIQLITKEESVDAVLIILAPQAVTNSEQVARTIVASAAESSKPILACFMGEASIELGTSILQQNRIPNYPFPERAANVLSAMVQYRRYRAKPEPEYVDFQVRKEAAAKVMSTAMAEGRFAIADAEAREILTAYGIAIPNSHLAENPRQATEIAAEIGYPVVLKVASPDILHKTDVGGVKVGLGNASDVRDAFDLITYRAQRYVPEARLWGCLVQEMVPEGLEVLIGMNRDPQFGPLLTFGLGGIYVEVLKDVSFRLAPLSRQGAQAMLKEIRAFALLEGVRGQPAVDIESILDTLLRVSQMVIDFPEIVELDINPFVAFEQGQAGTAIDMRLILSGLESQIPQNSLQGA
jgi:acetyltransferase